MATANLRLVLSDLNHWLGSVSDPPAYPPPQFPRLTAIEAALVQPTRLRVPTGLDDYLKLWQSHLANRGPLPSPHAMFALCWHPTTACSPAFLEAITALPPPLPGRATEGLIRSCHSLWSTALESGALKTAQKLLAQFDGRRRQLQQWQRNDRVILSDNGPARLGADVARSEKRPGELLSELSIAPESEFAHSTMAEACSDCRTRPCWTRLRELLLWDGWLLPEFKGQFERAVLAAGRSDAMRDGLAELARRHYWLGDPRLPRNHANWAGLHNARSTIVAWLSRFDIVFFFDHVLNQRNDPHGRKEFWLQYTDRLKASRPVLCPPDADRLRFTLREKMPDAAKTGLMDQTSAFILDFGPVVAVEFSAVGNALYMYATDAANKVIPDLWSNSFSIAQLKNKPRATARITHYPLLAWQEKASNVLARYGIRA